MIHISFIKFRFTSSSGEPQLHVASGDFFPSGIGWAMTPGCPYRSQFNDYIRRLLEAGLLDLWLKEVIQDPKRRNENPVEPDENDAPTPKNEDGQKPLGLEEVQGLFYIIIFGWIISLMAFILEYSCFNKNDF